MKRFITANIIMVLCTPFSVHAQVDSVTYYMQQLMPNRKVVRFAPLNKAAMIHAKYMIAHKKTCHLQDENPNHHSVRERTASAGDKSDFGYREVVWGGEPYLGSSIKESIYYFQGSTNHWEILTDQAGPQLNIKFGYARITTSRYDVCVIVLTNFYYDDPDSIMPKPSYLMD